MKQFLAFAVYGERLFTALFFLRFLFAGDSPAGCQKEKTIEGMLQIDAEMLKSNSKAVVDGPNSAWQAGDEIRFGNGLTKIHFF